MLPECVATQTSSTTKDPEIDATEANFQNWNKFITDISERCNERNSMKIICDLMMVGLIFDMATFATKREMGNLRHFWQLQMLVGVLRGPWSG